MQPRIEGYSYDPLASHGQANCSGESRAKIARLIEWSTIGSGVPGCMYGGGSPDGVKPGDCRTYRYYEKYQPCQASCADYRGYFG